MFGERWDEKCPHCEGKQSDIYSAFVAHGYKSEFEIECEHCQEKIEVRVEAVPEFALSKPEPRKEPSTDANGLKADRDGTQD